jgi:L-lactate permease
MFQQTLNPASNLWLTVLIAMVPFAALLYMLAALRLTAWLATILGGIVTILLGVFVWHAPVVDTVKSYFYGGLTGFWAIDWITFWGLIIFNTLVLTGRFDRFKQWMIHHATADIRIQTIMLAWAFGALLEGLVGFGYPWAVVVPILVGLGIADLEAIRVAALANNAPVSYGALGAPILGLAAVTGLPMMALSASVGSIVAILALLPPWVLIYLVSGWEGMIEAWPLAIVGSLSYIAGQWPVARYLGPYIPDLSGAMVSFWTLFFFVKVWRPKTIRAFGGAALAAAKNVPAMAFAANPPASSRSNPGRGHASDPPADPPSDSALSLGSPAEALSVWLPYIVLIAVVVSWTGPWSHLPARSWFRWVVNANSSVTQRPVASIFNFTPYSGGTSILASWLVLLLIFRPPLKLIGQVFRKTFKQMWGALLVAFFIFALAYIFVFTGMANSLAYGLSKIGVFFVVLAPILGWIGVALSGSNTATNAMFGPVQALTGRLLNLPVLLLPSFNSVGAEVGKPIAPQTASVGVSTSKLVRSEGQVIRHNLGWTLAMLAYLVVISAVFYFFLSKWMSL